jgi:hypothetical protein
MIEHVIVMMTPLPGGLWRLVVLSGSGHQKMDAPREECESQATRWLHGALTRTGAWDGVPRG